MKKQNFSKILLAVFLLPATLTLSNCARNIGAGTYTADHVGEAMTTYSGVIIAKRQVNVQEGEKLQNNTLGLVGGGVAGGVLGSTLGKGHGKTLAVLGGAAAGALAGGYAQQALSQQTALEYTVQLDDGTLKTVVQGMDVNLNTGQRVLLHVGHKGRSRIVPLNQ